jgi:hypothetical protein
MEDTATHSVWNIEGVCVAGDMFGTRLTPVPVFTAYWFSAISMYPSALVFDETVNDFTEVRYLRGDGVSMYV